MSGQVPEIDLVSVHHVSHPCIGLVPLQVVIHPPPAPILALPARIQMALHQAEDDSNHHLNPHDHRVLSSP